MNIEDRAKTIQNLKNQSRVKRLLKPPATLPAIAQEFTGQGWTVQQGRDTFLNCQPITNGPITPGQTVIRKGHLIDAQRVKRRPSNPLPRPKRLGRGALLFFDSNPFEKAENQDFIEQMFEFMLAGDRKIYTLPGSDSRFVGKNGDPITNYPYVLAALDKLGVSIEEVALAQESVPGVFWVPLMNSQQNSTGVDLTPSELASLGDIARAHGVILISEWTNPSTAANRPDWYPQQAAYWAAFGYDATQISRVPSGDKDPEDAAEVSGELFGDAGTILKFSYSCSGYAPPENTIPILWMGQPASPKSHAAAILIPPDAILDAITSKIPLK